MMTSIKSTLLNARVLHEAGDFAGAERDYRRTLVGDSSLAEVWYLLGRTCHSLGKPDQAVASYQRALALRPDLAEARSNLGIALASLGRVPEAMECYREAIRLRPDYAEAHNNLGNSLDFVGLSREAVVSLRQAIRLRPHFFEAYNNLGIVLKKLGEWDQAVACLLEAIRLKPDSAEAHGNLGIALSEIGKDAEAIAAYERALSLKPDHVPALLGRGKILANRGDLEGAERGYRESLQISPDSSELWGGLGFILCEQGRLTEGLDAYRVAIRLKPDSPPTWSNFLFHRNYDPEAHPSTLRDEHRQWGELLGRPASAPTFHNVHKSESRPLRVGYVSPDFRHHAVASFLEPILANHDRGRVTVFCYSDVASPDATTARLRAYADFWRETRFLTDHEVAGLIRRDQIDILVDLAGHTAHNRLAVFAQRPAPVEITYLGYPSTTGLRTIDAMITDDVIDPIDRPTWSTEEPLRVPGTFCCFAPPAEAGEISPLPLLKNGFPTFGSFHKVPKLNPKVIDLWSKLLLAIPNSRLVLVRDLLKGRIGREILASFQAREVDPARIELRDDWNTRNHWSHYSAIDLALDTFPWSGHTTACESLWMGVPVVTLMGDRRSSRLTASVLKAMNLTDLIAETPEQYIEIASRWVADPARLAQWRIEQRGLMRTSRLCDGQTFTKELESAFESLWSLRGQASISTLSSEPMGSPNDC